MGWKRTYIVVYAKHGTDGKITPMAIEWDGLRYDVDRVIDVRRRAATKAGGGGMRYTCFIEGKERYLFHDENLDHAWFVEERTDAL